MNNNYRKRSFSNSRTARNWSGARRSFNKKPKMYTWSETDLVKTIEYSKKYKGQTSEKEYVSINTFNDFPLCNQLKQNINKKGFKGPSPIQDQAIPHIINGRDLIGIANTGTGKTAAFLVPLLDKTHKDRKNKVLIIAPTRELAEQINSEFRSYASFMNLYSSIIIGGKNMRTQINDLRSNPNFVIGTPGRIKDLIQRRQLDLSKFNNVVLDEVDRMVDIGFINEIKYFISLLPEERQSLFFSATISKKVEEILLYFVKDPVTISVKKSDTLENITQDVIRVSGKDQKIEYLQQMLTQREFEKVIVFGNTKWGVQKIADTLSRRGLKAAAIHGDKRQNQRQQILNQFKKNEIKILLATDVAARGLDINNVSHVINFEMPQSFDDYIHRIGRTGRANKKGVALTFIEG